MRPHPVTVRTWDVGPDAISPDEGARLNPALGERALRLLGRAPELFLTQLRALLRAALHGPLHIMFPFAAGPGDLRLALALVAEAKDSLRRELIDYRDDTPIGLTIEVPSAAATIDLLARDVEFLSVGTNDLIQYLLAVDRSDPRVASLYQPLHPAVLRTIRRIVEVADAGGIPVSLCGEMASEPLSALVLVGLGVRTLSMTPTAIPRVKAAIRAARASVLETAATASLALDSPEQIVAAVRAALVGTLATD